MQQKTSAPSWSDYVKPQRCEKCGRMLYPAGMDWLNIGADQPYSQWIDTWNRTWTGMYDTWMQTVRSSWEPILQPIKKPVHSHRCESCQADDYHCQCCATDADLLIQGRVGERRIVPLVIENSTHRERQIELELSDWVSTGSQSAIQVTGKLMSPAQITLKACSEETVTLVVEVSGNSDTAEGNNLPANDVDVCRVYYADLRVKGCDMRPVRIAISLLPRDCAPYTIDCRCGCC